MPNSATPACARHDELMVPGHLGELTWQIPLELVDAVLAETNTTQQRLRLLPSRVGVYFVLALCLFPGLGYQRVWAKLTASLPRRALNKGGSDYGDGAAEMPVLVLS